MAHRREERLIRSALLFPMNSTARTVQINSAPGEAPRNCSLLESISGGQRAHLPRLPSGQRPVLEGERNRANIPTTSRAQIVVDEARQRREREAARAREAERDRAPAGAANPPHPTRAHIEVTSPGASPALTGPKCLSNAIRSESFPSSFKEPRKVPNYEPNMDPTS